MQGMEISADIRRQNTMSRRRSNCVCLQNLLVSNDSTARSFTHLWAQLYDVTLNEGKWGLLLHPSIFQTPTFCVYENLKKRLGSNEQRMLEAVAPGT